MIVKVIKLINMNLKIVAIKNAQKKLFLMKIEKFVLNLYLGLTKKKENINQKETKFDYIIENNSSTYIIIPKEKSR